MGFHFYIFFHDETPFGGRVLAPHCCGQSDWLMVEKNNLYKQMISSAGIMTFPIPDIWNIW
jgi:hypothetical protein